jgi:hypothetical protein
MQPAILTLLTVERTADYPLPLYNQAFAEWLGLETSERVLVSVAGTTLDNLAVGGSTTLTVTVLTDGLSPKQVSELLAVLDISLEMSSTSSYAYGAGAAALDVLSGVAITSVTTPPSEQMVLAAPLSAKALASGLISEGDGGNAGGIVGGVIGGLFALFAITILLFLCNKRTVGTGRMLLMDAPKTPTAGVRAPVGVPPGHMGGGSTELVGHNGSYMASNI